MFNLMAGHHHHPNPTRYIIPEGLIKKENKTCVLSFYPCVLNFFLFRLEAAFCWDSTTRVWQPLVETTYFQSAKKVVLGKSPESVHCFGSEILILQNVPCRLAQDTDTQQVELLKIRL